MLWSRAPRCAWFWLAAAAPGLLLMLLKAREIPFDLTHPANTVAFLVTIVAIPAALAIMVGGVAAFFDVRRGRAAWTRNGRAGWVVAAVVGAVVGAASTSVIAGSASAGGGGVADAPTIAGVITAENSKFVERALELKDGQVLGLFVINADGIAHAFDVDSLGIHVQLPADSTTAIAIKPTRPGRLEFYCSVPGHRDAGMAGTITVE
jgi:plastocyanin